MQEVHKAVQGDGLRGEARLVEASRVGLRPRRGMYPNAHTLPNSPCH